MFEVISDEAEIQRRMASGGFLCFVLNPHIRIQKLREVVHAYYVFKVGDMFVLACGFQKSDVVDEICPDWEGVSVLDELVEGDETYITLHDGLTRFHIDSLRSVYKIVKRAGRFCIACIRAERRN